MEFSISPAKPGDTAALVTLLNTITEDLHRKDIQQWEYPWNPAVIAADIETHRVWLLRDGNKIVGSYSSKIQDSAPWLPESSQSAARFFYLYRIALRPELQGQGIGKQLIVHAIEQANEAKLPIYLDCWAGNEPLKRFYHGNGFQYIGDFPEEDYQISVFHLPAPDFRFL